MNVSKFKIAAIGALLTTSTVAGAWVAARRKLREWTGNADPLGGVPVRFDGDERIVVTDDGAEISVRSAGSGAPVVLVHGVTGNRDDWGPIADRIIERGMRAITVDQRGHGGSTVGTAGYGAPRLGRDLASVLEQLDLRDVTLAGHSMGGMAALSMAVDRPDIIRERVAHLVPIATAASMGRTLNQVGLWIGGLDTFDSVTWFDTRLELGAGLAVFGDKPSLFMVQEAVRSFLSCPDDVRHAATIALRSYDVVDRLAGIDVRTTVVSGTRDLLTPLVGNKEIADGIPGARLEIIDGAGHMVIWEGIDEIVEILVSC